MIKLSDISKIGFQITWKLIDIGFSGSDELFAHQLTTTDVINYAIEKMMENDEDTNVVSLACEYKANLTEVDTLVKELAKNDKSDYNTEFRKWRVAFILENLPDRSIEFTSGLLQLGEIWIQLGFPDDSPHIFQGRNNTFTPEQYYTLNNYNALLDKHLEWIRIEIEQINAVSN